MNTITNVISNNQVTGKFVNLLKMTISNIISPLPSIDFNQTIAFYGDENESGVGWRGGKQRKQENQITILFTGMKNVAEITFT